MSQVIPLHLPLPPLETFLRVNYQLDGRIGEMLEAGQMPWRRFVFDADKIDRQADLVRRVKSANGEVILDFRAAEAASIARHASSQSLRSLPWANPEAPSRPGDFFGDRLVETAKKMAVFAVQHRVDRVLSPSHLWTQSSEGWVSIDQDFLVTLRDQLDRNGGREIKIDYQLITDMNRIRDVAAMNDFSCDWTNLPFCNLWIRTSRFGESAAPTSLSDFIQNARILHSLKKPIVLDYTGGFAALGALAFGTAGAIAHGLNRSANFDATTWSRPHKRPAGGSKPRIYVANLDRHLSPDQLNTLFSFRGAKSRFAGTDHFSSPTAMISHPDLHFVQQKHQQMTILNEFPQHRRADFFVSKFLGDSISSLRTTAAWTFDDPQLKSVIQKATRRLELMRDQCNYLLAANCITSRSPLMPFIGEATRQARPERGL